MADSEKKDYIVRMIPLKDILDNPEQTRKYIDPTGLTNLANSIREKGILAPILVQPALNNKFMIVGGQRRLAAAKKLGMMAIPAHLVDDDPLEIGLIENLQREDLHPIDEAESLLKLQERMQKKDSNYKQEKLAALIGKAQNTVSEILSLNRLPKEIRSDCRTDSRWKRTRLLQIAKIKNDAQKIEKYNEIKKRLNKEKKNAAKSPGQNKYVKQADAIIKKAAWIENSLQSINLSKLETEKRNELKTCLVSLKTILEEIQNKLT